MCVSGHSWGQEIENWLPPGYRCGVMPHHDSWNVSYSGKHLAKRSFKKYGGKDGAVKELLQHTWLHAQSLDPTLACPHRSLFEKTRTAPPTALAGTSSSSSSSKATVSTMQWAQVPHLLALRPSHPSSQPLQLELAAAHPALSRNRTTWSWLTWPWRPWQALWILRTLARSARLPVANPVPN